MSRVLNFISHIFFEAIGIFIHFTLRRFENAYRESLWRRKAMNSIAAGHIITIPEPFTIQVEFQAPETSFTFFDPPLQRQKSIMDLRFLTAKKKAEKKIEKGKGSETPLVVDGVEDVD